MAQTANTSLGLYDPLFYANEALISLERSLGLAGRVHRGYEKAPQEPGSKIKIKGPATFTATDVNTSTGGTTQDLATNEVEIALSNWKEVKFALTDKELTYTGEKIIQDHIRPAAYAMADAIDLSLCALYAKIPWVSDVSSTPAASDITAARKVLFNNGVPMNDDNLHMMISGSLEAGLLNLSAFSQAQGAGDVGTQTQMRGYLGRKYGFEIFANQNTPTHTSGTMADTAGAVDGVHAKGATAILVKSLTDADTIKAGDSFSIAGFTQRYVVTADVTVGATTSTKATVEIYPALAAATAGNEVVTFKAATPALSKVQNMAFHRDWAALAMAPLSNMGGMLGAKIATVQDPITGLTLRSRIFYDGDKSLVKVALDALWGVAVLNPNRCVRMYE